MPFKVVQTVEKGKPVLTAVPHSWEKAGTLFWPKYQADKLIKVEDLYPEDSWIPIPCELKRDNLRNYDEAQVEISSILCMGVGGQVQNTRNQSDSVGHTQEPSTSTEGYYGQLKNETNSHDPLAPAALSAGMELILENQRVMLENQKKIMRKINEYLIQLNNVSVSQYQCYETSANNLEDTFTPMDSVEELNDFEKDLKDVEKRNALYKKFSAMCHGRGHNSAYFFIDTLFTRRFMAKCSWSGGSRKDESKVPLKIYNNTINFFHQVVYDCDKTFSLNECHKFLKGVLKNAVKRMESKGLRTSHRRMRRKQIEISYINEDGDDYESGDLMEQSHNSTVLSRKHSRTSEVEMSDSEMDVEKE